MTGSIEHKASKGARKSGRVLGFLIIVASLVAGWYWLDYSEFLAKPLNIPEAGLSYSLPKGANLRSLAEDLKLKGVLAKPWYFRFMARKEGTAHQIKAGEYLVPPGTKPADLLQQFIDGKTVQHALTIIEGWSFAQVMSALKQNDMLEQSLDSAEPTRVMALIGHPDEHPEGRFLPDTYAFPRGTTDVEFLKRAYRAMEERLAQEWEGRSEDLPLDSAYEALILASIVEKETGRPEERPEIAGVFVRRLKKGMKLQTDPTVIYGMGEKFDGNIRRKDLLTDTPYNTYTRTGLPPTPISMPGAAAIHAVLHPADGNSLYFVSKGDGTHQFSATLDEHNKAVAKYQLKR